MVSGAPGAGKTAVVPALRSSLSGVVVLDLDDFLPAASKLAGVDLSRPAAADRWPAYDELCLRLVAAVAACGQVVLLLSPLTPEQVQRSSVGLVGVRWAVLDCSDDTRRRRLTARELTPAELQEALDDAAELRVLGIDVLPGDGTVADAAQAIASWTRRHLGS